MNKIIQIISHDSELLGLANNGKVYRRTNVLQGGEELWIQLSDTLDKELEMSDEQFNRQLNSFET